MSKKVEVSLSNVPADLLYRIAESVKNNKAKSQQKGA